MERLNDLFSEREKKRGRGGAKGKSDQRRLRPREAFALFLLRRFSPSPFFLCSAFGVLCLCVFLLVQKQLKNRIMHPTGDSFFSLARALARAADVRKKDEHRTSLHPLKNNTPPQRFEYKHTTTVTKRKKNGGITNDVNHPLTHTYAKCE
jgi:hypothetical protein